jgi:hypothetical protein
LPPLAVAAHAPFFIRAYLLARGKTHCGTDKRIEPSKRFMDTTGEARQSISQAM